MRSPARRPRTHAPLVRRVGAGWAVAVPGLYVWEEAFADAADWSRALARVRTRERAQPDAPARGRAPR